MIRESQRRRRLMCTTDLQGRFWNGTKNLRWGPIDKGFSGNAANNKWEAFSVAGPAASVNACFIGNVPGINIRTFYGQMITDDPGQEDPVKFNPSVAFIRGNKNFLSQFMFDRAGADLSDNAGAFDLFNRERFPWVRQLNSGNSNSLDDQNVDSEILFRSNTGGIFVVLLEPFNEDVVADTVEVYFNIHIEYDVTSY